MFELQWKEAAKFVSCQTIGACLCFKCSVVAEFCSNSMMRRQGYIARQERVLLVCSACARTMGRRPCFNGANPGACAVLGGDAVDETKPRQKWYDREIPEAQVNYMSHFRLASARMQTSAHVNTRHMMPHFSSN